MSFGTWAPGLRTHPIMDRGLRLVVQTRPGVDVLYPIPVRHPVPSRYPASAGRLPSEAPSPVPRCHTAIPFASTRLGLGLTLTSVYRNHRLTLKNMCRARHTQLKCTGRAGDFCVHGRDAAIMRDRRSKASP